MPPVYFACEELQKHWPCYTRCQLQSIQRHHRSKQNETSFSICLHLFFTSIFLQNYAHHVDSSHLSSSGRPTVCGVPRICPCLIFSVTLRRVVAYSSGLCLYMCFCQLCPGARHSSFVSFQQCLVNKAPTHMQGAVPKLLV